MVITEIFASAAISRMLTLSRYALNAEQEHEKHRGTDDTPELEKLLATVRLVRTLREPALPDPGYPKRIAKSVAGNIQKNNPISIHQPAKPNLNLVTRSMKWWLGVLVASGYYRLLRH